MDRSECLELDTERAEWYESPYREDGSSNAKKHITFRDILEASDKHCIPSVRIDDLGIRLDDSSSRMISSLGSGLTSKVIRHVTGEETKHIVRPNTTVAAKVFRAPNQKGASVTAEDRRQVYEAILSEIQIVGQRSLRSHPNIVHPLFMGWQKGNPFPILAMQLGDHGSLDHIIQTSDPGPSVTEKRHITFDIALGLSAIHRAGFNHRDLKPHNILVMVHDDPSRRLIAKLSDFGGSFQSTEQGLSKPIHFTEIWCAPEVLNRDHDVDWEKADVYAFGLVVGSLWSTENGKVMEKLGRSSPCFLSGKDSGDTDEDRLWTAKSNPHGCAPLLKIFLETPLLGKCLDEGDIADLLEILTPTLHRHFWRRPKISDLIQSLDSLRGDTGRDIVREDEIAASECACLDFAAHTEPNNSWADDSKFEKITFEQCSFAVEDFSSLLDFWNSDEDVDILSETPEDLSLDRFFEDLSDSLARLTPAEFFKDSGCLALSHAQEQLAYLSWELAKCYFFGKGTSSNLETALAWMRASALCGLKKAMHVASMIATRAFPQSRFPIRLWLSLLALSGSDLALERLRQWEELSRKVREIIQEQRLAYRTIGTQGGDMLYLHSLAPYHHALPHVGDPVTTIQQAIEFKAITEMEQILEESTEVQDPDLLHQLVHLIDAETLPLAREAFMKGAKLDALIECQSSMLGVRPFIDTVYSPLSSAILHGKQELAIEIFCFHIESDAPITDFPTALFLSFRYLQHEVGELLIGLLQSNPSMCRNDTMPWIFDEAHLYSLPTLAMSLKAKEAPLHHLLVYAMHHDSLSELERQAFSGDDFDARYQTCLEILLEKGADPTEGPTIHCPLYCALVNDDLVGLKLFIEHIESRQPNQSVILNHLRNPGKRGCDNDQRPALLICIRHNSVRCFEFLIRKFPVLKFDRIDDQGNTLLLYACSNSLNTDFVKLLIEDGIDTTAMDFSNGLFNPLLVALTKGHLSAADLIADRCSPDELERYLSQDDQGVSIFCCIVVEATHTELTSSVKWLIDRGGAHFYGPDGTPIWYALFAESRPTSHEDQMRRAELLETMLGNEMFSTRLNTERYQGLMLLHVLALNGHVEVIERLVKLGGDVNAVVTIGDSTTGYTALDIVNARLSGENYPPKIKAGGRIEMKRWVEDLHKIVKLLRDVGCGGYNHPVVPLEELLTHGLMFTKHRRFQGDWPLPLPSEGSSNWLQDFIDNKIASAGIAKDTFDLFVDNVEHDLEMNKHKSIKKSNTDHDHPESNMDSRQTAQFLRKTWRLPPEWGYVTAVGMMDMTFYVNHETGEMTEQKPSLYRGEDGVGRPYDRKGKGKAPETANDKAERTRRMLVITAPPEDSVASNTEGSATKEGHNVFVIFDDPDTQDEFSKTFNGLSLVRMVINKIMLRVGLGRDLIPGYKAFVDETQDVIRKSWSDLPPKPDATLEEIAYEVLCKGSIEKLKMFIEATDMVEKESYLDSTPYPLVNLMKPLHDAIVNERWEEFETLVETSDIESENHAGYTPLHWAILLDHRDMVRTLLAHGANTDKAISGIGIPPLHCSVLREDIPMTKLLLEFGADPNGKAPNGALPLQLCNLTNRVLATLLIEKGANISMARKAYLEQTAPSKISQRSLDVLDTYVDSWESHAESSLVSLGGTQINNAATSSHALSSPDDDPSLLSRM
ncbi:hypothetical protein Daesc_000854 [Daldinia eschscholtzii]|uniref:Protein kinase domain-containing protein n=1 Tax=Daldinia eschscholtzii TaxID=292717 RepID=A0AAX6N0U5_9PEZI